MKRYEYRVGSSPDFTIDKTDFEVEVIASHPANLRDLVTGDVFAIGAMLHAASGDITSVSGGPEYSMVTLLELVSAAELRQLREDREELRKIKDGLETLGSVFRGEQ